MTEIANEIVPGEWRETPFTGHDRCDRGKCNAAALVRTFHKGVPTISDTAITDLIWCAHHYSESEHTLAPTALHVQDERQALMDSEQARQGKDAKYV